MVQFVYYIGFVMVFDEPNLFEISLVQSLGCLSFQRSHPPRTLYKQFLKEFLSLWRFGEVWGIFPGYVGKIFEY